MQNNSSPVYSEVTLKQALRTLYRGFGYTRFKMSKFEEYDTYAKVKDFLISDKVITFTDTNGKLLAMKPDVTVSIIKNLGDTKDGVSKVYYNENVYRVAPGTTAFREIMQAGLECIGDVDTYQIAEVVLLAVKSLSLISDSFVLNLSHMGFVSGMLDALGLDGEEKKKALRAVGEKNMPALLSLCTENGFSKEKTDCVTSLIGLFGPIKDVAEKLSALCQNEEMERANKTICAICDALLACGKERYVNLDFSVVNDMNYYNGIVFTGYVEGVPAGVLSGGQYDKLMQKMGKPAKAIGFAVYLDQLESLKEQEGGFDADVLIVYDETVPSKDVLLKAEQLSEEGKTVFVSKGTENGVRAREVITLSNGGVR